MNTLPISTPLDPSVERLHRFQSLQAGQYWRARVAVPDENIPLGEVLLLESIRWVDDEPHTIILRTHPSKFDRDIEVAARPAGLGSSKKARRGRSDATIHCHTEHRFLLKDFLAWFEFEPGAQRVRAGELAEAQRVVAELQNDLVATQADPSRMNRIVADALACEGARPALVEPTADARTPAAPDTLVEPRAPTTVAAALAEGVTVASIAQMREAASREHKIATIKANWIQQQTGAIAEAIAGMTPYYQEQAAAALAHTEDVRECVAKLIDGIASLDLYIGKDVTVTTIRGGTPAPREVPLTFVQRKLMMDEELALWADVDASFDWRSRDAFFDALREHDGLVAQLFPTERCVLVMATTRRHIEYGDVFINAANDARNKEVFLLVRNGLNIHMVNSPVETHLGASRLFPTVDEQERPFRGIDGQRITFDSVAFTDSLKEHERAALHYKRFLLLACGLDHRLRLFGDFYDGPASLNFVSLEFQERHCRFLQDDESSSMLTGPTRPPVDQWVKSRDAFLCAGSRVLCHWMPLFSPETAPGACNGRSDDREIQYLPAPVSSVETAYRHLSSTCVDVLVSGYARTGDNRSFMCRVDLSKSTQSGWGDDQVEYLCLDMVEPDDLRWYMRHRGSRASHLQFIRFFKRALAYLEAERETERDTRARMLDALERGGIGDPAARANLVSRAAASWRAANCGRPLPRFDDGPPAAWTELLNEMHVLAGEHDGTAAELAAFAGSLGLLPLRMATTGNGRMVLYLAPSVAERDDRLEAFAWAHRLTVARRKAGCVETGRRWSIVPKLSAAEATLHEWPEVSDWIERTSSFLSPSRKADAFDQVEAIARRASALSERDPKVVRDFFNLWCVQREDALYGRKRVPDIPLAVPIGFSKQLRGGEVELLCAAVWDAGPFIASLERDPSEIDNMRDRFASPSSTKQMPARDSR